MRLLSQYCGGELLASRTRIHSRHPCSGLMVSKLRLACLPPVDVAALSMLLWVSYLQRCVRAEELRPIRLESWARAQVVPHSFCKLGSSLRACCTHTCRLTGGREPSCSRQRLAHGMWSERVRKLVLLMHQASDDLPCCGEKPVCCRDAVPRQNFPEAATKSRGDSCMTSGVVKGQQSPLSDARMC